MDALDREEIIAKIKEMRLMDDFFMMRVFDGNIEVTQLVLRIILGKDDLVVKHVKAQETIKSLSGRGACLDVLAVDSKGAYYNIEVQRAKEGADFRRARYNSALLDTYITKEGDEYKDLPNTYVIFITEKDILKGGLPIYEIGKFIQQTGQKIDDGTHVIYVNGDYRGDGPLGRLMADFRNKDYKTMNYEPLQKRVGYFKGNEKGVECMCAFSEELLAKGEARGRLEGRFAAIVENVRNMMDGLKWSSQAVMDMLKIPAADRPAILAAL